jgi:probable phosphoglycerate mutase
MSRLLVLRHGPTDWNRQRRLQGHIDTPLAADAPALVRRWRLPAEFVGAPAYTSPLIRAQETARLMGLAAVEEPALRELSWGDWEGEEMARLNAFLAEGPGHYGLDFAAPGGESHADLIARLRPFLAARGAEGTEAMAVAVAHRGVIRALYALATGWDMASDPPDKLAYDRAQIFRLARDGTPTVDRLNVPLVP